ncbi:DNA (cytosine-5-)-methyltransferase [Sphaerisporangium cinnabarinum]|nr:DNA (cytosine-5-)-methyltransferase [Sphaerisporangium cinnabarinum]PTU57865.1 DNA (cytosine-5-)-methyltransferase [Sphaerisporangium cinnabarinum]
MSAEVDAEFTFIDLFAGVGGFHAALEKLGGRCVYASEKDKRAWAVYQRAWGVPQHEGKASFSVDIRDHVKPLLESELPDPENDLPEIPEHDVLTAGFPCQAFSKSGKQKGTLDETRGTLFYDILRIIRARRPKIVFLENVKNLVGPRHRDTTFETIIGGLKEYGYLVSRVPTVISPHRIAPQAGGTPQVRERVYIMAVRRDLVGRGALPFSGFEYQPWDVSRWNLHELKLPVLGGRTILEAPGEDLRRYAVTGEERTALDWWELLLQEVIKESEATATYQRSGRWIPGHPIWLKVLDDVWRDRELQDAEARNLPWKANFIEKNLDFFEAHEGALAAVRQGEDGNVLPQPDAQRALSRTKFEWQAGLERSIFDCLIQFRPSGIRVRPATYTPALVAINQTPIYGPERRRLTPREVGRLQAFPERVRDAMEALKQGDGESYKQFGNAVHVGAVRFALGQFLTHLSQWDLDPSLLRLKEKLDDVVGRHDSGSNGMRGQGTLRLENRAESEAA